MDMTDTQSSKNGTDTFSEQLNRLLAKTGATYMEIVIGTKGAVQQTYLSQLRNAHASNPSFRVIAALSEFFQISPAYFFGETDSEEIYEADPLQYALDFWLSQMPLEDRQVVLDIVISMVRRRMTEDKNIEGFAPEQHNQGRPTCFA
jgi:transcriptional regulator with XRE-family HTH domain